MTSSPNSATRGACSSREAGEPRQKGHGSWHEDPSDGQARWNVRVRNMEVMAEWATKAALDYGLVPQAPQELRDTIVKGLHKVADLHA